MKPISPATTAYPYDLDPPNRAAQLLRPRSVGPVLTHLHVSIEPGLLIQLPGDCQNQQMEVSATEVLAEPTGLIRPRPAPSRQATPERSVAGQDARDLCWTPYELLESVMLSGRAPFFVRDTAFREDASKIRTAHGPAPTNDRWLSSASADLHRSALRRLCSHPAAGTLAAHFEAT
ncbi:hypothetical protein [Streptomyces sp. bgisy060]|uniref:hypothetical protein n=1 Tax=Streptomyces sp. bgisy060 TaxID=3413775 RepID=UPI003EB7ECBD